MKLFICIAAFFSSLFMGGDKYSYYTANHDYSIMISTNSKYEQEKKDDGGYQDFIYIYDGADSAAPAYLISVVKILNVNVTTKDLFDTVFYNSFQNNCGCTITATSKAEFKTVNGLQIDMKMTKGDEIWKGYSINIISGSNMYSIDYLASEKNFDKYKADFKDVMNSLKVYR